MILSHHPRYGNIHLFHTIFYIFLHLPDALTLLNFNYFTTLGMHKAGESWEKGSYEQGSKDKDWGRWVLLWGEPIMNTILLLVTCKQWLPGDGGGRRQEAGKGHDHPGGLSGLLWLHHLRRDSPDRAAVSWPGTQHHHVSSSYDYCVGVQNFPTKERLYQRR